MSSAIKCDICRRFTDGLTYELPHPDVRVDLDTCEDCYDDFMSVYNPWLQKRGFRKSDRGI